MRLLNVHDFKFEVFYSAVPKYAILSHRWDTGRNAEASIQDVQTFSNTGTLGYRKVRGFRNYVASAMPNVEYVWIDTCCINQDSSAELTEAINSIFKWYRSASVCIAYLADVKNPTDLSEFRHSMWFRRGWTLQELLAPATVVFVTCEWKVIGHKGRHDFGDGLDHPDPGPMLNDRIAAITGIPEGVLGDYNYSRAISANQKLDWMTDRVTLREEDQAYCLLGLFDVNMPVIYGEGQERAKTRLLAAIADAGTMLSNMSVDSAEVEMPPRSLHEAASRGQIKYIADLLESTPSAMGQLWKRDAGGSLPLHRAAQAHQPLACKILMAFMNRQSWDLTDLLDASGKSPVMKGMTVARVVDVGGPSIIRRALAVMRKLLQSSAFFDVLEQALSTAITSSDSEKLVTLFAAEAARLPRTESGFTSKAMAKIADTLYDWASDERIRRLTVLKKAVDLTAFTGRDGINFLGKAIVDEDLKMIGALHVVDSEMFSKPVGRWTKNKRTDEDPEPPRYGPWKPLRFSTLIGKLEIVRHLALFTGSEHYDPPSLLAVHLALTESREAADDSPGHKAIWHFLRDQGSAQDESSKLDFQVVTIKVEIDSDWGLLMFPHRHEAEIQAVQTVTSDEYFTWDSGCLSIDGKSYHSRTPASFVLTVKLRSLAAGCPEKQSNFVHMDFLHGYNDFGDRGGQGRVIVSRPLEDMLSSSTLWFREVRKRQWDPLDFERLQGNAKLDSGAVGEEYVYNLRTWQMLCMRK